MARAIPLLRACTLQVFVNYLDRIGVPTEKLLPKSDVKPLALAMGI